VATELAELQNAMAKLMTAARQHDDQLLYLTRRINELDAQNRGRGGSGFAPPPSAAAPSLPPVGTVLVPPPSRGPAAGPPPPASAADDLFQTATAKYQAGDLDAAVIMMYDLIATYPTHPLRERAQYLVADIFYTQKDLRGALVEFEALLAAVPGGARVPDALLKVGLCQRGLGDEARARRAWERVVREYPSTTAARQARALLRTPKG
jgi:tol-pal system protein YbgF